MVIYSPSEDLLHLVVVILDDVLISILLPVVILVLQRFESPLGFKATCSGCAALEITSPK